MARLSRDQLHSIELHGKGGFGVISVTRNPDGKDVEWLGKTMVESEMPIGVGHGHYRFCYQIAQRMQARAADLSGVRADVEEMNFADACAGRRKRKEFFDPVRAESLFPPAQGARAGFN